MLVFQYITISRIVVKKEGSVIKVEKDGDGSGIKVEDDDGDYEIQEVRQVYEESIPRGIVQGNIDAPVTIGFIEVNENADKGQYIDFRILVGAAPAQNVDYLWEAFSRLVKWIYDGKYDSALSHTANVNSCIIADIFEAPAFMNIAMVDAIYSMAKEEENLKSNPIILRENYRNIFALCKATSPIYRLYFEASVYWKLNMGAVPSGSEIHLGLDPSGSRADAALGDAQLEYKLNFCKCKSLPALLKHYSPLLHAPLALESCKNPATSRAFFSSLDNA